MKQFNLNKISHLILKICYGSMHFSSNLLLPTQRTSLIKTLQKMKQHHFSWLVRLVLSANSFSLKFSDELRKDTSDSIKKRLFCPMTRHLSCQFSTKYILGRLKSKTFAITRWKSYLLVMVKVWDITSLITVDFFCWKSIAIA